MAVVNDALMIIGGERYYSRTNIVTNTLLSLFGSSWEEVLPPMPTKRVLPAAANTPTHLVVAGGKQPSRKSMATVATVEVLNTETLQWSTASSLPQAVPYPRMTTCGGCIYLAGSDDVFWCSMEDLSNSVNSSIRGSVWTSIPAPWWSSLATLKGRVLAIGGGSKIHCYDVATNSWSVIGETPTPRARVLSAILPSNELVVVEGFRPDHTPCATTEIATCW